MNTKIIDNIVWWIPFRKLRHSVRELILYFIDMDINTRKYIDDKINYYNNENIKYIEDKMNYYINENKEYLVIWDCTPNAEKCIAKHEIKAEGDIPQEVINDVLSERCFNGESFLDIEKDITVTVIQ